MTKHPHPIRRVLASEEVLAAAEAWAEVLLAASGTGTVEVSLVFNVKDRRYLGLKLGGTASRMALTPEAEGA